MLFGAGKRWMSLGLEKQKQYREEYVRLKEDYNKEMERFLEEHPEARSKRAE